MVFDQDSIYPFLLLVLVPASLGLKIGWQAISVVRRCCIPIGVIVCLVNAMAMLANMDSPEGFLLTQRLVYAPLAFGIFLSFSISLSQRLQINLSFLSLKSAACSFSQLQR